MVHLKIALRVFLKSKGYNFLNIAGLVIHGKADKYAISAGESPQQWRFLTPNCGILKAWGMGFRNLSGRRSQAVLNAN